MKPLLTIALSGAAVLAACLGTAAAVNAAELQGPTVFEASHGTVGGRLQLSESIDFPSYVVIRTAPLAFQGTFQEGTGMWRAQLASNRPAGLGFHGSFQEGTGMVRAQSARFGTDGFQGEFQEGTGMRRVLSGHSGGWSFSGQHQEGTGI